MKPDGTRRNDNVSGTNLGVDAAAGSHTDEGVCSDVVKFFHGNGGGRSSDACGANADGFAFQRSGINVELPVLTDVAGVLKAGGNGFAPPRITRKNDIMSDISFGTANVKLIFEFLHDVTS